MPRVRRVEPRPSRPPRSRKGRFTYFLFLILIALLALDWQFRLTERIIGRHLVRHNDEREPWGTLWTMEEKARTASRRMEEESAQLGLLRERADRAGSFGEIAELLGDGETVVLSPSRFVSLYLALPEMLRPDLIPPKDLLAHYYTSDWRRTLLTRPGGLVAGCRAVLLDAHDQPLLTLHLEPRFLFTSAKARTLATGGLAADPAFAGRIYPGEKFIQYLFILPEADRNNLFPDPEMLLSLPKPLRYVGLAPERGDGFAVIGFEAAGEAGPVVATHPISPRTFERLAFALTWEGSDTLFAPSSDGGEAYPVEPDESEVGE
ncbi:MAG: hypothetical protein FJY67_00360 [Calditrichaeota bacterium]|nr:hypothetical protein [Calditrichota bacterium]